MIDEKTIKTYIGFNETIRKKWMKGRNMMKRGLAAFLTGIMTVTLMAAGLTGCGSNTADKETEKVRLMVWSPSEDQSKDSGEWIQTMCNNFAKEHPEWNITFDYVTCSESDAKDTVLQDPASAADVFMFANDQIAELVDAGALTKLGGDAAEYVKSSNPEAMAATVTYNGDIYGVPYTPNTWFMYYDKRVFSEDDVKSLDTMLEKGKVSFPFDNGWYLASFYAANGCTIFGDGTDASKGYDFGGDNAVAVTKYIVDLFNNKNFVMDNNEGSLGLAGLKDGSVNAYFNGNWNYDAVVKNLGEENVGVAALPTINVDGKDCQLKAFLGSKAIGVNPNCKNQEVAVKLAAYLGSEDAQLKHFELRKQAPVNTNLVSNEEVAKDAVASTLANVAANCSIAQPIIPMQAYWDAATPFGDAFVHGAEGQITADNAKEKTEALNEQLNSSLTE